MTPTSSDQVSPSTPPTVFVKEKNTYLQESSLEEKRRIDSFAKLYATPQFPNDTQLHEFVTSLRSSVMGTTKYPTPDKACDEGTNSSKNTMTPSPGLHFSVSAWSADDPTYYEPEYFVQMDAYDSAGGHIGLEPVKRGPDFPYDYFPVETSRVWYKMSFGSKNIYILQEIGDAKIVIHGKTYGATSVIIRGEGNSCDVTQEIAMPITPYSIITIPITKNGDIGPIKYDVDGNGTTDFEVSLVYQITDEQLTFLNKISSRLKVVMR